MTHAKMDDIQLAIAFHTPIQGAHKFPPPHLQEQHPVEAPAAGCWWYAGPVVLPYEGMIVFTEELGRPLNLFILRGTKLYPC